MSAPILPFELPLPWEHDADGSDIYINEPIHQVMMPRGWGWLSKKYGDQRAERIQRDAVKFAAHAVNHHLELVTRLYNLVNAVTEIERVHVLPADPDGSPMEPALSEARETLKKLIP